MIYKLHHQANGPVSQKFDSFVRDMQQESGIKEKANEFVRNFSR